MRDALWTSLSPRSASEKEVRGLEITVDDAAVMRLSKRLACLKLVVDGNRRHEADVRVGGRMRFEKLSPDDR